MIVGHRSNYNDISFGGYENKTAMEILQESYADDFKFGEKLLYGSAPFDTPISLNNTSEFIFPLGVCQIVHTYEMTEFKRLVFQGLYPHAEVYLTDPGIITHSSIDLSSHTGDKIACGIDSLCTYEISIIITDLRHPVDTDTCSDETSFNRCVEEQTKNIFHEVKYI